MSFFGLTLLPLDQALKGVRGYFAPPKKEAPTSTTKQDEYVEFVLVENRSPPTTSEAKVDITTDTISKWAPLCFSAFVVTCSFFRFTGSFVIGVSFAAYLRKYPDHLSSTIKSLAEDYFPVKGKKYGRASVLVEHPETSLAALALASMWSPPFAQMAVITYFTFRATTTLLSTQAKENKA